VKSFTRYAVILTLLIALFAVGKAFAEFIDPPDAAPPGCYTQITEAWPEGTPSSVWGMGHFDKEPTRIEPSCGMTIQYIDPQGVTITHTNLVEGRKDFPDGSWIDNVAHFSDDGLTVTWESTGAAPEGETLTRGSSYNGQPDDPEWTPEGETLPTPVITLEPTPILDPPATPHPPIPPESRGGCGDAFCNAAPFVINARVCSDGTFSRDDTCYFVPIP
jgi:hypothetical protein